LADYRTSQELMGDLRRRFGTGPGSWYVDTITVRVPPRPGTINAKCIVIDNDEITFTVEDAQWLLARWM
jgi:hypothetical protein